jgi:virulence factor Mce-like protein
MNKGSLTRGRIAVALLFALSCFGLLLFLWLAFGGPVPLKPKGYRVSVLMPSAPLLAEQADVRISGVPVGKVLRLERDGSNTRVTIQIRPRYAPLRDDVRAVIRRKTLLGEGFVELTPGSPSAPDLAEDGTILASRVQTPVALDEIWGTFDPPTRAALQQWFQGWAAGLRGRGEELSGAVAHLGGAAQSAEDLLGELRRQRNALSTLGRDGGRTFAAIGSHEARVADLIRNGRDLFAATAESERELAATFRALPGFLDALRSSSAATQRAAIPLTPLLADLRPAGRSLPRALAAGERIAPELRAIARPLDRVSAAAPRGLAAATAIVRAAGPLVEQLYPLGRQLVPIIDFAYAYRREFSSFAKTAAATQSKVRDPSTGRLIHYLRAPAIFPAEPFTTSAKREPYNRGNAYMEPGGLEKFVTGPLEAFDCRNTGNPVQNPPLGGSPPCIEQKPWTFRGVTAKFPHLKPAP